MGVPLLVTGTFFIAHFGGFMVVHFLFIYELFLTAGLKPSQEPPALQVLGSLFTPLWPALLALVLSHGASFVLNFLLGGERLRLSSALVVAGSYRRIVVMHLAILVGGFAAILLHTPLPALVLLVLLKLGVDLAAHRHEHAPAGQVGAKDVGRAG